MVPALRKISDVLTALAETTWTVYKFLLVIKLTFHEFIKFSRKNSGIIISLIRFNFIKLHIKFRSNDLYEQRRFASFIRKPF